MEFSDLAAALNAGIIAGAGLDVVAHEPMLAELGRVQDKIHDVDEQHCN